jgi:hypothetical protein
MWFNQYHHLVSHFNMGLFLLNVYQEFLMNLRKYAFLILILVLFAGCLQTKPSFGQEDPTTTTTITPTYLPLLMRNWPYTPSFGVEIHNFDVLSQAAEANNYWMRYNGLLWSDVQPNNNGELQWVNVTALEENLKAANLAGMEMILIVRSTPAWAQKVPGYYCGPMKQENIADFSAFMRQVVARYSQPPYSVKYYEIWNEPDGPRNPDDLTSPWGCWGDAADAYYSGGYYAEMLKQVYPAIKAANPKAQVVLGGLLLGCDPRQPGSPGYCPNVTWQVRQPKFLEGILINGGGAYFDYLNFHGYNYYTQELSAIKSEKLAPLNNQAFQAKGGQIEGKLNYLNQLQTQYGISKPIIVSEAGLLFAESADAQSKKADYVVYLFTRNLARGIAGTTWYTFDGPGWRNSGMLDADQNPLPAYNAYKVLTTALDGAIYKRDLSLGTGIIGFEFEKENRIWVLFSEDGSLKSISTPAGFSSAYDLFETPITPVDGKINFTRPIYIEFSN